MENSIPQKPMIMDSRKRPAKAPLIINASRQARGLLLCQQPSIPPISSSVVYRKKRLRYKGGHLKRQVRRAMLSRWWLGPISMKKGTRVHQSASYLPALCLLPNQRDSIIGRITTRLQQVLANRFANFPYTRSETGEIRHGSETTSTHPTGDTHLI